MIRSMTGFGKAIIEDDAHVITVEVKSLNSKFLELNLRLPRQFSDKELEARNLFTEKMVRGKVNVFIDYERKASDEPKNQINKTLLKAYHDQLKDAAMSVGENNLNLFNLALNMPDVMSGKEEEESIEEDWKTLKTAIDQALTNINTFREDEGKQLSVALNGYITLIGELLTTIEGEEPARKKSLEDKLRAQLNDLAQQPDENRYEQELIYYLEKLDISEEKVRLRSHLDYFNKELNGAGGGKKLGFIAQEIGREINTIGSKANYAPIQHAVVQMKDELEKIKEQVLNLV